MIIKVSTYLMLALLLLQISEHMIISDGSKNIHQSSPASQHPKSDFTDHHISHFFIEHIFENKQIAVNPNFVIYSVVHLSEGYRLLNFIWRPPKEIVFHLYFSD
jgi:hypothetical protein